MKKTLESYNSAATTGATSKNFLVPSWSLLILYILISLLVLAAFNFRQLWNYLLNEVLAPGSGLDGVIAQNASGLNQFFNAISQSIVLQVFFWICIGSLVYVLIWLIRNVVVNLLNDVVADNYIHPPSYNRFNYWESVIARKVFFGASLMALLFYFFAAWRLTSSLAGVAYTLVAEFMPWHSLLELSGIILVVTALLHTLILLTHITVNSWRFIYRDL